MKKFVVVLSLIGLLALAAVSALAGPSISGDRMISQMETDQLNNVLKKEEANSKEADAQNTETVEETGVSEEAAEEAEVAEEATEETGVSEEAAEEAEVAEEATEETGVSEEAAEEAEVVEEATEETGVSEEAAEEAEVAEEATEETGVSEEAAEEAEVAEEATEETGVSEEAAEEVEAMEEATEETEAERVIEADSETQARQDELNGFLQPIFFNFNRAEIRNDQIKILEQNLALLKEHPDLRILVGGHADRNGDAQYNWRLSLQRAKNVKMWLLQNGISAGRINVAAYGETKPHVNIGNGSNWESDRFVEITVAAELPGETPEIRKLK
jgi:outer membrane protein OmpA-like peptidoglycan-associated protein